MQILSLGNFGRGWDNSICDEEHIASALEELGHTVHRHQREENAQFIDHPKGGYDFILIAQWDGYPKTLIGNGKELPFLEALKENYKIKWELGAENTPPPIVYWAFDYQADGQEWHEDLIAGADLYLSKRIADSKYPNWQYLSQNFAPAFLGRPRYNPPAYQDIEVLFTGSYLPWAEERNAILKLVDGQFNLVIHSVNEWPGFSDVRPPIMDEGLPELYNRAQVILSIDHTLEAGYHSDRNSQIMCSGFKPLFRYVPLSEVEFHDHVEYFYNIEDCLKKIEQMKTYGQSHLSEKSYNYAQNNLKVKSRVKDLLTIVRSIL